MEKKKARQTRTTTIIMKKEELAKKLFDVSHLTGKFLLRSGQTSNEYFDKYQFESRPDLLSAIADYMIPLLPKETQILGAMEMGGIPIATAIALRTGHPLAFLRKEAKSYGTCKFAEGIDVKNKTITIIEDVITTGGQVIITTEMLKHLGANITEVLCVIDRSTDNHSKLKASGLKLTSLFKADDLKK